MRLIGEPGSLTDSAGEWIRQNLRDPRWTLLRAAAAFVRRPGVAELRPELDEFVKRSQVHVVAGIDNRCTSIEGLSDLHEVLTAPSSGLWVFHNEMPTSIFHPKIYSFENADSAAVLIGSSNLTMGGLVTNYEGDVTLELRLGDATDRALFDQLSSTFDRWTDESSAFVRAVDQELIAELARRGYIPPEVFANNPDAEERPGASHPREPGLFGTESFQEARRGTRPGRSAADATQKTLPWELQGKSSARGYVMTLQNTDVGVGQTTPGTARRSPEVFIPLGARDDDPNFWGWPDLYVQQEGKPHIWNRDGVRLRLGGTVVEATFMVDMYKHDLRIRSEALRSTGSIGDILRLERPTDVRAYDYYAESIPPESALFATYEALCTTAVRRPSVKKYGYY